MPDQYQQYIDDYLLNKLSDKQRMDFENALANSEDLRNQLALRKVVIKGAKNVGRDKMKGRLKTIHREVNQPPTIQRRIWPYLSGIAATIALLIISWIYFFDTNPVNPQELFAANYEAYPLSLASRSTTDKEAIARLNEHYNNKEYKAALPLFEKALSTDPQNARMLMGSGICLLELNQTNKAQQRFTAIITANDLRLSDIARWYLALTYLKEGNTEAARSSLTPLLDNPNADRHKEAKALGELIG